MSENGAFNTLVIRNKWDKSIFIGDRGFESVNSFVYVMKAGKKFLVRVKDINSNGILSSLPKQDCDVMLE